MSGQATFKAGSGIHVTGQIGPGDQPYTGRFGHFVQLARCGCGVFARVILDGHEEGATVLLHQESIQPVYVQDIEVQQEPITSNWYATCHSKGGDDLEQWGTTADKAAKNLHRFATAYMGYAWPDV